LAWAALAVADRRANETPIETDALSIRTANCLKNEGIATYEKLARMSASELLRIPNFGRRSLNEMKEALLARGLKLTDCARSAD
jgi:DNA-directed RNA polymerase subunit alpha